MKYKILSDDFVCELKGFESQDFFANALSVADLLSKYKVVVIRNSGLSLSDYRILLHKLGKPHPHVLQNFSVDGYPDVIKISNLVHANGEKEGVLDGGTYWHSDMSYKANAAIYTSLLSHREPSHGGFTQFIDMSDALCMLKKKCLFM